MRKKTTTIFLEHPPSLDFNIPQQRISPGPELEQPWKPGDQVWPPVLGQGWETSVSGPESAKIPGVNQGRLRSGFQDKTRAFQGLSQRNSRPGPGLGNLCFISEKCQDTRGIPGLSRVWFPGRDQGFSRAFPEEFQTWARAGKPLFCLRKVPRYQGYFRAVSGLVSRTRPGLF